ncbi:hypothetical protein [Aeromonas jandaei]|uniref:hypothetical protein n=1 Tax=Aeromonas jandaei TaxID=650 RepID=UPI003670FAFB
MDEQAINELGQDAALDLAVHRERLTRQIEDETALTKASKSTISDLTEKRQKLLEELEKQGPLVDYSATLEEHHKALIERLKAQAESADRVAQANEAQAEEITKQTSTIRKEGSAAGSTFKRVSKETTLAGNVANKMIKGASSMISAQIDGFLNEIPLMPEARQAAGFVKSVMPTKGKDKDRKEKPEKRIQTVSQLAREKAMPQPIATAPAPLMPSIDAHKKPEAPLSGKIVYRKLDAITDEIKRVNETTKAIHDHLVMKAILDLVLKAGLFSGLGLLIGLFKKMPSMLSPKPTAGGKAPQPTGKPDPTKPDPKKVDPKTDPTKTDPKKTDPKKPEPTGKPDPAKGDKVKPQPEPATKQDLPKSDPTKGPTNEPKQKPSSGSTSKPSSGSSGGTITKLKEGASAAVQGAKTLAGFFIKNPAIIAAGMKAEEIYTDTKDSLSGKRVDDINKGLQDWDNKFKSKGTAPVMQAAEPPISEEGARLDEQVRQKEKEEQAKAERDKETRMAQMVSVGGGTTVNTVNNNVSGGGSGSSVIPAFGNEYQTPSQKGSMIQR